MAHKLLNPQDSECSPCALDCPECAVHWMTFSEALEQYLTARDIFQHRHAGWKDAEKDMKEAADVMDAYNRQTIR